MVGGLAAVWAFLLTMTGSMIAGSVLFLMLAVAATGFWIAARCLGLTSDHPWIRQLAVRPWRNGSDVLRLALRHLPEVFIVSPSGSLLAPTAVELRMNPDDLSSLTEMMELSLINSSATEVYREQVTGRGVALAGPGPATVTVLADPAVPAGRYRIRQGRPLGAGIAPAGASLAGRAVAGAGHEPVGRPGGTSVLTTRPAAAVGAQTVQAGSVTVAETAQVPLLRLVSNGCIAETRISGARAGRGSAAELGLPAVPTVSRVHATFAYADGHWQITSLGRNGVLLNGKPLAGSQPVRDGDTISWGHQADALVSRVEIGWERALPSGARP